jgi:hypothetical protein
MECPPAAAAGAADEELDPPADCATPGRGPNPSRAVASIARLQNSRRKVLPKIIVVLPPVGCL